MNLAHSYFHFDLCVDILVRAQYHSQHHAIINPRRMREGYGGRSVCVSVISPAAMYLVTTMQTSVIRLFTAFSRSELCGFR